MKKSILVILIVVALLLGYQNRSAIAEKTQQLITYAPCDTPIPYSIGTIDERFNLSKTEFLQHIQQAENTWSTAYGKQLFVYDPQASFTVNLIYDERQSLQNQINELDTQLETQDQNLQPQIDEYEKKVAEFNANVTDLNQRIDSWNAKGGAPEDVYQQLQQEQQTLQQTEQELRNMALSLGQSTDAYNTQIEQLGQTVDTFNETLIEKPEQGLYIQTDKERKILIYFTNSDEELVHTLAHEFGHALGMEHVQKQQAIMHAKTNEQIALSPEDIAELQTVCKEISVFEKAATNLAIITKQMQAMISGEAISHP